MCQWIVNCFIPQSKIFGVYLGWIEEEYVLVNLCSFQESGYAYIKRNHVSQPIWKFAQHILKVRGLVGKMPFFQMAPGSILSIQIHLYRSQYELCEVWFNMVDHIHTNGAAKVKIFSSGFSGFGSGIFVSNIVVSNHMALETSLPSQYVHTEVVSWSVYMLIS